MQGRELSRRLADAISALVMTDTIDVDKQYELYAALTQHTTEHLGDLPTWVIDLVYQGEQLAEAAAASR